MELKAHFTNIHKVIIGYLEDAEAEIIVAIAWFTDRDIFEVLCNKARAGTKVSVVLIGDKINQGPGGLNFQRLRNYGGAVAFFSSSGRNEPLMHHKFCVIDRETVITGSYNWSQKARTNDENITVVTDAKEFACKYLDTFEGLLARTRQDVPDLVDAEAARRRLEMIRSLILLGEHEDVSNQLRKLRSQSAALQIVHIITALDNGQYSTALEHIDSYLRNATALIVAGYADIPILRFQLEILEVRLESLSDERADLERRLITFNRRHDDALGNLIRSVLKARAAKARLAASFRKNDQERAEAEAAARQAEDAYDDYSEHHEELKRSHSVPELDADEERELRALYRKACSLCHPDKVTEDRKEAAHSAFVELQDAYRGNNLIRLQEIYDTLKHGGMPGTRSSTLIEAEALRTAIAEMEYSISEALAELKALQVSDGVSLMNMAGETEADWESFFEQRGRALRMELEKIESEIVAIQSQGTKVHERTTN